VQAKGCRKKTQTGKCKKASDSYEPGSRFQRHRTRFDIRIQGRRFHEKVPGVQIDAAVQFLSVEPSLSPTRSKLQMTKVFV